ncbi:HTH-type sugar sensing transcriptional regulator TrmBL1 [Candidatus Anstonella stagnisolia]|nr:HTH-type sugar sensing transcriptional regulator TrmBL1 [Candidatus Anstonella stagnisolia]
MDAEILEEYGLSNSEARVYLILLENGQQKSGEIIRESGLQSSSVYNTLSALMQKGIVSYVMEGKVKLFQAEKPETFLALLEEKGRKFREMLPKLQRVEGRRQNMKTAKVYEGLGGLKTVYENVLSEMQKGEEYFFFQFAAEKIAEKRAMLFYRTYHSRRDAKGVRVRGLATVEAKPPMREIFEGFKHVKLRYVNGSFLPTGTVIYHDKVVVIDWEAKEPTCFLIQSKTVAESYKELFEEKWKVARA